MSPLAVPRAGGVADTASGQAKRALVSLFARTPNRLMLTAWGLVFALYYLGPVTYHRIPTVSTWVFVSCCTLAFLSGGWLHALQRGAIAHPVKRTGEASAHQIARIASIGAWLGIVGIASIAADKLVFSGLDYSQGITFLRLNQDAEMLTAGTVEATRTPLLYFGYLIVASSVPSYLIFLLRPQAISRRLKWLVHLAVLSPVGIAFLYGGRSPIILVCALVVGAMIVRCVKGQRALPYSRCGVATIIGIALCILLYIHYIFAERLFTQGVTQYEDLVRRFELVYNATPSPLIDRWLAPYVSPAVLMTVLNMHLYFTHEFSILDLTLSYTEKIGPYFGQYQFYLLSVLLERFVPSLSFAEPIRSEAQAAGVFGWFSTVWGGMYLDFGYVGALLVTAVCGYVSAALFGDAVRQNRLPTELIACYVAAGILISPNLSPFTVSISLPIFTSILASAWLVSRDKRENIRHFVAIRLEGDSQLLHRSVRSVVSGQHPKTQETR